MSFGANLAACSIAKKAGCSTIARINNPELTDMPEDYDYQQLFEDIKKKGSIRNV